MIDLPRTETNLARLLTRWTQLLKTQLLRQAESIYLHATSSTKKRFEMGGFLPPQKGCGPAHGKVEVWAYLVTNAKLRRGTFHALDASAVLKP